MNSDESKAFITSEVKKHKGEGEISESIAFLNAVGRSMAVTTSKKAIDLLVHSERIFEDLDFRLTQMANKKERVTRKPSETICLKIILRTFRFHFYC